MFGNIDKSKGLLFINYDLDHSVRLASFWVRLVLSCSKAVLDEQP
jgi:hypothetical protein